MSKPRASPAAKVAALQTINLEGITFQQRRVLCGKLRCRKGCRSGTASHGPYWYAVVWNATDEKSQTFYIGKTTPTIQLAAKLANTQKRSRK